MKRIVFLEGLPGVGKTTVINRIDELKLPNVYIIDEIVNRNISKDQIDFILNDELKISKYNEGLIIIDRGLISTLSYNQTRKIIDSSFDSNLVIKWFEKVKDVYNENTKTIYLTNNQTNYYLPYKNDLDPYGSSENQKLLESITMFNCQKYAKNLTIKEYYKDNLEEIINEIIN